MPPRKTHSQSLTEVHNRYGGEYEILGEYATNHTPIKIKHVTCGHILDTTAPYDFLKPHANTCPTYMDMSGQPGPIYSIMELDVHDVLKLFPKV